jgi:hypothetical protein
VTTSLKPEPPHHRSLYCVKQFGCQRIECRVRASEYTVKRHRLIGYGTWQPLADAQPVREHVQALRDAGASTTSIAHAAKVSTATLARIIYGDNGNRPGARMRHESADALLAVRIEDCKIASGTPIDATGTRRRLQALVAAGWSFTALAAEIGIHSRPLGDMARATRVRAGSAHKVKTAYKRLVLITPEQAGVHSQARKLARRVAEREGWLLAGVWEDIDDPNCQPDTGTYRPIVKGGRDSMRRAEIAHLLGCGESIATIARRMSLDEKYISDLISQGLDTPTYEAAA